MLCNMKYKAGMFSSTGIELEDKPKLKIHQLINLDQILTKLRTLELTDVKFAHVTKKFKLKQGVHS